MNSSPKDSAEISVVVVNWNTRDALVSCLLSLEASPPAARWEALVVDNASTDGSVEAVRRYAPWARVLANQRNLGLAPANNQGLQETAGTYVLLCNADIVIQPGAIDAMARTISRHDRAAFVIPRLRDSTGAAQTAAGDLPRLAEALVGRRWGRSKHEGFWWHSWAHDEERQVGHGAEACYLVRRQAIEAFGPQDERFPLDWEGIEWSARAKAAGWEVWFCPSAEIVHAGGESIKQATMRWIAQSHIGMYRYFSGRFPVLARPPLMAMIGLRAAVKMAAAALGAQWYERARRPRPDVLRRL